MQDRPRAGELLEAIADFLMKEVMPAIRDRDALAYKTLVSWNMLGVVSRELREGEALARGGVERLLTLLGSEEPPAGTYAELLAQLETLNTELAGRIRDRQWSVAEDEVWSTVRANVRDKLRISNPRFGTE